VLRPQRSGAILVVLLGAAAVLHGAQEPQAPVFRGGAETVAIYATVLDRAGEVVPNLGRGDFDVYDDGRRQELTVFESGLQPITAAVLVDTSASMTLNLDVARSAAEQFVIRMLPGDRARVGSFSDRVDLSPAFTGDRDTLLTSLREGLHIGNPTKLWDAVDETMTALRPLGGRRIILLLTDGMDTASRAIGEAVFARTRADDLMIYIVQFRSTPRANLAEVSLSPSASELFGSSNRQTRSPSEVIRRLAAQTGGGHFLLGPYDDVNATFTHVMQELHYQYVLGFTPDRRDGRMHQLQVRVRRPNVSVRARQGYLAAGPS
jgi:Ca-activated chloride channel family protein